MNQLFVRNKFFVLHIMVIILGFTGILGNESFIELKNLDEEIQSSALVFYRMIITFIVLFIFISIKDNLWNIKLKELLEISFIGFIVGLHWIFFFESVREHTVIGVICLSTSSLFTSIIEPIVLKRKISQHEILLGIIIIVSICIMWWNTIDLSIGKAYLYGIISSLLAALFTVLNAKYVHKISSTKLCTIEMFSGSILVAAYIFLLGHSEVFLFNIESRDLIYLLILSIICTAMIFVLMTEIMKYISPYTLVMAINLEPVYTVVLCFMLSQFYPLLKHEIQDLNIYFYITASFMIISTIYLNYHFKKKINLNKI